jgi:hypothetical protein
MSVTSMNASSMLAFSMTDGEDLAARDAIPAQDGLLVRPVEEMPRLAVLAQRVYVGLHETLG